MKKKKARPVPVPKDVALLHGPTEDGEGARVLRLKDGELYAGEVRPVREGQPVNEHELVRLRPIEGRPAWPFSLRPVVCSSMPTIDESVEKARRTPDGDPEVKSTSTGIWCL